MERKSDREHPCGVDETIEGLIPAVCIRCGGFHNGVDCGAYDFPGVYCGNCDGLLWTDGGRDSSELFHTCSTECVVMLSVPSNDVSRLSPSSFGPLRSPLPNVITDTMLFAIRAQSTNLCLAHALNALRRGEPGLELPFHRFRPSL